MRVNGEKALNTTEESAHWESPILQSKFVIIKLVLTEGL